jgi:hypothetical protein
MEAIEKIRRIQPGGLDRLKCDPDPPVKHEKDFTEGGPKFRRLASPTLWSAPWRGVFLRMRA